MDVNVIFSCSSEVAVAGVIFNRVGGAGHVAMLEAASDALGLPMLGAVPRDPALALPDRHLGLVQAHEHPDLEAFLDRAAKIVSEHVRTAALEDLARPATLGAAGAGPALPPLGQRIAVAQDEAFAFCYPVSPAEILGVLSNHR